MSSVKTQAISGVSANVENTVMTVYPSMACTGIGRVLGQLYDSIPLKINGIKLSNLLFPLPLSPIALVLYFWLKVTGNRYVLTNRSLQVWQGLGARMRQQVQLADIADIDIHHLAGQAFYKAGDLVLYGTKGDRLLRLGGIIRPDVFRQTILKARDARMQNDSALATIRARQTA
jgi:hypothetical protein